MKNWMPIGAVAVILVALVVVFTMGPFEITGNARGLSSTSASKVTLTDKAACPKGKSAKKLRNCEEGTVLQCDNEKPPYCCECVEAEPTLTCANVLCTAGTTCIEDCDGSPVCVPQVCEGIAGVLCPEGFNCELDKDNPDAQGSCDPDCEDQECGTCKSDDECKEDERCTASEDCLSPCDCPQCTVCSGHCVQVND